MVSEAHCMSFPRTELLSFNYAKVKTVFHSMAPLIYFPVNTSWLYHLKEKKNHKLDNFDILIILNTGASPVNKSPVKDCAQTW